MAKGVSGNGRTLEQVKRHYEVEKELASRLRNASREERRGLYCQVYAELFRKVPEHPSLREDTQQATSSLRTQMEFLGRFLTEDAVLMEIGSGICMLSLEAAKYVKKVYALDVEDQIAATTEKPDNFELVVYDGTAIPLPEGSIDIAYSNQVIEHLHPDDAARHARDILKVLAPGGMYICTTPHRFAGPYDISMYFDDEATCLHLKEYTTTELSGLFKQAGFAKVSSYGCLRGHFARVPLCLVKMCEAALGVLPYSIRKALAGRLPLKAILGVRLVGRKAGKPDNIVS
jgi:SAM-dependent methyltransferase